MKKEELGEGEGKKSKVQKRGGQGGVRRNFRLRLNNTFSTVVCVF